MGQNTVDGSVAVPSPTLFRVFFDWLAEKNYWSCILIDEDEKEFDCWVVD